VAFVIMQWQADRLAALLFVPYALWAGFASLLNAALYWLN
jgi:benzodiazapine receptor